jgi:hypothetical protein
LIFIILNVIRLCFDIKVNSILIQCRLTARYTILTFHNICRYIIMSIRLLYHKGMFSARPNASLKIFRQQNKKCFPNNIYVVIHKKRMIISYKQSCAITFGKHIVSDSESMGNTNAVWVRVFCKKDFEFLNAFYWSGIVSKLIRIFWLLHFI